MAVDASDAWAIRTTVRNYLHSAVRNRARDLIARSKSERRATDATRRAAVGQHSATPEDELLAHELASAIEHGLNVCAARCRAALLLLEDHSRYADIARQLGVQPGTVHTLIARGRRRLRAYLREQGWEDMLSTRPPLSVVKGAMASCDAEDHLGVSRSRYQASRNGADRPVDIELDLAG